MFRTLTHCAIVTLALILVMANTAAAALINTYTGAGTGPAVHFTANITVGASSSWAGGGYSPDGLVSGFGFSGSAGAFTDADVDGFPEQSASGAAGYIWITDIGSKNYANVWVSFSFDDSYDLASMRLWNKNQWGNGTDVDGVEEAYLWYSNDAALPSIAATTAGASPGTGWTQVPGGLQTFSISTGASAYDGESVALGGVTARHFLIDVEDVFADTVNGFTGLSAVQFSGSLPVPVPEPSTAVLIGLSGALVFRRRQRLGKGISR